MKIETLFTQEELNTITKIHGGLISMNEKWNTNYHIYTDHSKKISKIVTNFRQEGKEFAYDEVICEGTPKELLDWTRAKYLELKNN